MSSRRSSKIINRDRRLLLSSALMSIAAGAAVAIMLALLAGSAASAQDKYTVQVPNGLSFSEFSGYEDRQAIAVSQTEDIIEVILGNPMMIDAYRAGVAGNGWAFPGRFQDGEDPLDHKKERGGACADHGAGCPVVAPSRTSRAITRLTRLRSI
jgi:hypothetical protein